MVPALSPLAAITPPATTSPVDTSRSEPKSVLLEFPRTIVCEPTSNVSVPENKPLGVESVTLTLIVADVVSTFATVPTNA